MSKLRTEWDAADNTAGEDQSTWTVNMKNKA
jgi:hypothetical protein